MEEKLRQKNTWLKAREEQMLAIKRKQSQAGMAGASSTL